MGMTLKASANQIWFNNQLTKQARICFLNYVSA